MLVSTIFALLPRPIIVLNNAVIASVRDTCGTGNDEVEDEGGRFDGRDLVPLIFFGSRQIVTLMLG